MKEPYPGVLDPANCFSRYGCHINSYETASYSKDECLWFRTIDCCHNPLRSYSLVVVSSRNIEDTRRGVRDRRKKRLRVRRVANDIH